VGNPFASATELEILRLLRDHRGGLYGLEIVKTSGGSLARGTVYTTLGRMEDKGLVKSRTQRDAQHPGLPRPRYTVSGLGERVLAAAEVMGLNTARA
jgi:DNA-binding PadR family transcriptional regulator